MASSTQVIHAYRSLYRNLLKAVQHTIPARFVVRDQLRSAFREKGASFDETGIKRTVWFLEAASKERGLEHKILKNLIAVQRKRYPRDNKQFKKALKPAGKDLLADEDAFYEHYDMTVAMLNKTMGLCLR